jgi:hypothetical protein
LEKKGIFFEPSLTMGRDTEILRLTSSRIARWRKMCSRYYRSGARGTDQWAKIRIFHHRAGYHHNQAQNDYENDEEPVDFTGKESKFRKIHTTHHIIQKICHLSNLGFLGKERNTIECKQDILEIWRRKRK